MKNKDKQLIRDIGIITRIGELKTSQSNLPYRSFVINLNTCDQQEFIVFRDMATNFCNNFKIGYKASISFTISSRKWFDKNNNERITTQLHLNEISKVSENTQMTLDENVDDSEIPF